MVTLSGEASNLWLAPGADGRMVGLIELILTGSEREYEPCDGELTRRLVYSTFRVVLDSGNARGLADYLTKLADAADALEKRTTVAPEGNQ